MLERLLAVGFIIVVAGMAGCLGGEDAVDPASKNEASANFTPCEHPWPCADGSEWPTNLTAPDEHPRQPPVLPEALSMEGAETVERGDRNVTFRWTVPTTNAVSHDDIRVLGPTERVADIEVPSGLFLELSPTLQVRGGSEVDARGYHLDLRDASGAEVCSASLAGPYVGSPSVSCTSGVVKPLDATANWTVELEHENDRADEAEVEVTVKVRVAEPATTFPLMTPEHARVESFDGTTLDGHVWRPDVPDGVQVPVVLWSSPYFGQTKPNGDSASIQNDPAVPVFKLVQKGYAVAAFNVRGTGLSEGCLEMGGANEQRDQAVLVEWLADQPWSNGRVAMMGLSYDAATAWEAAIQAPPALKTIVTAGTVSDWYTFHHTPQGAVYPPSIGLAFQEKFNAQVTFTPPAIGVLQGGPAERATTQWAPVAPDRVCPEVLETMTALRKGTATDDRNPSYWEERRFIDGFPNVTAAVLLTHGFQDKWDNSHGQQELAAWQTLPEDTPKHQLEGQWEHEFPNVNTYNENWTLDDWHERLFTWLDFWLKGLGDPPDTVGTVEYQDGTGDWHETDAWPPPEARRKALYLAGDELAPAAVDDARTFRSAPDPVGSLASNLAMEGFPGPLCTHDDTTAGTPHGRLYTTKPLEDRLLLAGNPYAYVMLESDLPGGLVTVTLLDLGPEFRCDGSNPIDARALTTGSADLRFHDGSYQGSDFPTGTPTEVRIDLTNLAQVIEPDHRLAALVSYGDPSLRTSQPFTPNLDVDGTSHLVLPVVGGDLGAELPDVDYPPRPFVPPYNETGDPDP